MRMISMKNSKTIVCDVDDTISVHHNRDYKNAIPNLPLIKKLNALYDAGWEIIYQTARGQLSFNGDIELIEKHRRPVLEEWMHRHGVKYTQLSFQKKLAQYYIDDKAIRPDEFLDMKLEVLHGGSGAEVRREGNRVIKTQRNAIDVYSWYNRTSKLFPNIRTPQIYSLIDDTITMEYIPGTTFWEYELITVCDYIASFRDVKQPAFVSPPFITYITRIDEHLKLCNHERRDDILKILYSIEDEMNTHISYCHGDLTIGNCIVDMNKNVYLIDPNPAPDMYSSWLLDVAKLYQSIQFDYEYEFMGGARYSSLMGVLENIIPEYIKHLIPIITATHFVRMIKYKDAKYHDKINQYINTLLVEHYERN